MNKRQAKRRVCARVAAFLHDEVTYGMDLLSDNRDTLDDLDRLQSAAHDLIEELSNRAGLPSPLDVPPQLDGQRSIFDELGPGVFLGKPVETIRTDVL